MMPTTDALPTVADLLEAALPAARWFAGKGRAHRIRALVALPWLEGDELPAVRFEIAEVVPADGRRTPDSAPCASPADEADDAQHYLIPMCYRSPSDPAGPGLGVAEHPELGPVSVHDATADPYAGDILLRLVSTERGLEGEECLVRSRVADASRLRVGLPPRRFGGEQSNTSLMFGDVAMLKFFRRLEFGTNLDIEVHRELAGGPAGARIATLYGWLDAEWVDSTGCARQADLGMLVEQLPGAQDGWELAVDHVAAGRDFRAHATELGQALREVHHGLADAFGTDDLPGSARAAGMRTRLGDTIEQVPQIAALRGALDSRLARLDDLDQPVQRIHGDFHLGQTLLCEPARGTTPGSSSGWRIIDFEGEPLKSLDERREFDTVWRDVAGMLRSFDYAGAYAIRERGADPHWAMDWVQDCVAEFVSAYAGRDLDPTEQQILQAYQIDKAAYECRYEAGNRPDWLPIPLSALASLAETTERETRRQE